MDETSKIARVEEMQKLEDERDPEMAALVKAREEEIWKNNIYEIRGDIGKL